MAFAPKYDGFGGGWGTIIGGGAGGASNPGTATAMGTMQTAALPTQALGSSQGTAFQRQNFGNTAAMATQNIADLQYNQTIAPDAMKTQPAGTYANTYDPMATRAPQAQADGYGYGGSGYGGSGYGGSGGRPSGAYGTQIGGAAGAGGAYGANGYDGYGGGSQGAAYGGSSHQAYGGSACGGYGGAPAGGYGGYGYGGQGYGQNYGAGAYGGYGGAGAGYGNYGYGGASGVAHYGGYNDRGYGGNDMVATQQLSAQQVYSREVPGSFATGGYNAYVSSGGYPPGQPGAGQMPMGRKPGRTRRSICC